MATDVTKLFGARWRWMMMAVLYIPRSWAMAMPCMWAIWILFVRVWRPGVVWRTLRIGGRSFMMQGPAKYCFITAPVLIPAEPLQPTFRIRSEERRVGKECIFREYLLPLVK